MLEGDEVLKRQVVIEMDLGDALMFTAALRVLMRKVPQHEARWLHLHNMLLKEIRKQGRLSVND